MTAQILPNAKSQFIDSNGKPLAGGSVYFYIPNTSTPKSTWQDPAQTILNTNPIILDASGQALIWGSGVYRQVVYDQFNNLIWDQITEDANAGLTGNLIDDIFVAGTDFIPGTTTQLTLNAGPGSIANTWVFFDGVYQADDQTSVSGTTLSFTSPIPVGTSRVTVKIGTTVAIGTPGNGTVMDSSIAAGSALNNRVTHVLDVTDPQFGAKGNGVADDTVAIQAAITKAASTGYRVYFPSGTYKITAPLNINTIGIMLFGDSMQKSNLVASGNFASVLNFLGAASYCFARDIGVVITGTTTKCVNIAQNAVVIRFSSCYFDGDLTGDLCYSNGQNVDFDKCTWQLRSAGTWAVNFDCFNQNAGVTDCRIGGSGNGVRVTNVFSPVNQQQGLRIEDTYFINTGSYNVWLGNSFLTTIVGCVLDQSSAHALHLDNGASGVMADNCYLGSSSSGGIGVYCAEQSTLIQLVNLFHGAGTYGVVAHATASNRVDGLSISNCIYNLPGSPASTPLLLDSVLNCTISNCVDALGTATNGSWNTQGTFGAGSYTFANNRWFTAAPLLYHAASSYKFINDTGIVGRFKGSSAIGATTSLTLNHFCFTAPSTFIATPNANAGNWWIDTVTATQFTIHWTTSTAVTWSWEADCSH
jgi:hypothetical protein